MNCLVEDYNAIVAKRLPSYKRMNLATSGFAIREEIREVLRMADKAKQSHHRLEVKRMHPIPIFLTLTMLQIDVD